MASPHRVACAWVGADIAVVPQWKQTTPFTAMLLLALMLATCAGADPAQPAQPDPLAEDPEPETPIWPISAVKAEDADSVHSPVGPRVLGETDDFHAARLHTLTPRGRGRNALALVVAAVDL